MYAMAGFKCPLIARSSHQVIACIGIYKVLLSNNVYYILLSTFFTIWPIDCYIYIVQVNIALSATMNG
jgi:hypothetical protein